MTVAPQVVSGLAELSRHYDAVLCDVWGVIHNGRESFPAACEALARYKAEVGPVILMSNAPRPNGPILEQLASLGVTPDSYSKVVTSGDATRRLLSERAPGPAWKCGPDRDDILYEGLDLQFSDLETARFIACTGLFDDETEEPADYRERLLGAAERGLEMICANPDIVVQRGDKLIYCGGALAKLYESLGGVAHMAGKPYRAIYDICLSEAGALMDRPLERGRVLCIGDGLPTDIRGANAQGLDALFIANGIHGSETIAADGTLREDEVAALLHKEGLQAKWAMPDLVW